MAPPSANGGGGYESELKWDAILMLNVVFVVEKE